MDGRVLPLRQWEGEVMVRAVGTSAILQNALGIFVLGPIAFVNGMRGGDTAVAWLSTIFLVLFQVLPLLAGRSVLLRRNSGRVVLAVLNGLRAYPGRPVTCQRNPVLST